MSSRREFIIQAFGISAYSFIVSNGFRPASVDYLILSASHTEKDRYNHKIRYLDPQLAIYNSRTDQVEILKSPSLAHSIVQHPINPRLFLCLPRIGKTAFIFDYSTKEFRAFDSPEGLLFYGHGVFSKDGKSFYTSESVDSDKVNIANERFEYKGTVHRWNLEKLELISELDTYGYDPHDMVMLDDQKAVITNGGLDTNVAIVDLEQKKLIKKFDLEIPGIVCRHILRDKQDFYVLTAVNPTKGGKYCSVFYPEGTKLKPFDFGEKAGKLRSQLLSGISTDEHIVTVAPKMNAVHFWNKQTKSLERVDLVPQAAGVALYPEQNEFIVTTAVSSGSVIYGADDIKKKSTQNKLGMLSGRHTYLYRI